MSAPIHLIRGDRCRPRLPVQPHLRAVNRQPHPAAPGCPLIARFDGRLVPGGVLTVDEAAAALVAGEA